VRPGVAALAVAVAAVVVAALGIPVSAASWVDREWTTASLTALDCDDPGVVDSTAWGRVLTGSLSGQTLDPVAAIDGITVSNLAPATVSSATSAATTHSVTNDAWTSDLGLTGLGSVTVGAGVSLPFGAGAGTYTQYGRATSSGLSVGAAGAVTTAADGVASLEPASSATPRLATLQLSSLLDSSLPGLGVTTAQLSDLKLRIGVLGAIASYASCDPLWNAAAPGPALTRDYLVKDLGLDLTSSTISGFTTGLRASLATLETNLDALLAPGTSVTGSALSSITTALTSALGLSVAGVNVSLGSVNSVKVGVDFSLQPVIDLVTGSLSDGVVTVNLSTGAVSADLAALFDAAYAHSGGLNGLSPNTSVLTAPVLAELQSRIGTLLQNFATGTIQPALTAALNAAAVTAVVDATLRTRVGIVNVLGLKLVTTITGTPASFTTGTPAPTVSAVASEASSGILNTLLSVLGISLGTLVTAVQNAVVAPMTATVVPVIGSTVVAPVMTSASGLVTTFVSTLTGTTIPGVLTSLAPVLTAVRTLVAVTVNARPDAAGSVGAPAATASGRYFETALHVGVVDGSAASVASLFVGNASVGANALR
jgi:hypothetical protein